MAPVPSSEPFELCEQAELASRTQVHCVRARARYPVNGCVSAFGTEADCGFAIRRIRQISERTARVNARNTALRRSVAKWWRGSAEGDNPRVASGRFAPSAARLRSAETA